VPRTATASVQRTEGGGGAAYKGARVVPSLAAILSAKRMEEGGAAVYKSAVPRAAPASTKPTEGGIW
jgi:hypothetical protein